MAATISTPPPDLAYNADDIWVEFSSDLQTAAPGYIDLIFSSTGPTIGQTLQIEWGGNQLLFTVAATTNDTATAIPTKSGGETLDEYALRVGLAFRENYLISQNWLVTVHTDERVRLTLQESGAMDITVTNGLSNVVETVVDGVDNTVESLSAMVEVWTEGDDFNTDEKVVTLQATYSSEAQVNINLREIFPVEPHLPNAAHIAPTLFLSWPRGIASDCYIGYYLRYADKYGAIPVPNALLKSDSYFVLNGSTPADMQTVTDPSPSLKVLHNYRRADGEAFWKPIGDEQPDWIYVWIKEALTGVNVSFTVLWDTGVETDHPYGGSSFSLSANKAYYIRSTPLNFDFTPPSAGALPWYITFELKTTETTLATVKYKAMPSNDWERCLLFDNGRGGCEVAHFRGKTMDSAPTSRSTARVTRTTDFAPAAGELLSISAEMQRGLEMNTGWIPRWYAHHLRQLLLGDIWLIDIDNKRFLKMLCESESIDTKDDESLYNISLKLKFAWMDQAAAI